MHLIEKIILGENATMEFKREMSTEQLARLFQTRSQPRIIYFDTLPVPNTYRRTLREPLYRRFIKENVSEDEIS